MSSIRRTNSAGDNDRPAVETVLRGRTAELAALGDRLREAEVGRGGVVLLEGCAGSGKSRLLDEARRSAAAAGFSVGRGAAKPGDDTGAMTPLWSALFDGAIPVLDRDLADLGPFTAQALWVVPRLEAHLEQVSGRRPVLLCLDDAHWMDAGTAAAVRVLTRRLSGSPVVWMLAFSVRPAFLDPTGLSTQLRRHGAETLSLGPLDHAAIEQLVGDITGGEPTNELVRFACRAAGRPSWLVELVRGLVEEGSVVVNGGRADLSDSRLPQRVRDLARRRLASLSVPARQAVTVTSVLGGRVSYDHLATMLHVPPASLLAPVEELVLADLFVDTGDGVVFPSDLSREAVLAAVPPSLRYALQQQAIEVLFAAGVSPVGPAMDLAASARPGDRAAVSTLMATSRGLAQTDTDAAAHLARRAYDLTLDGDEQRAPIAAETARLLHAAGRPDEALGLAAAALRDRLGPDDEATIRMSVAQMSDVPPDARVEAGQIALGLPDVSAAWRARHLSELVINLATSGRPDAAKGMLAQAETSVASSGDSSATVALDIAKALFAHTDGAYQTAVERLDVVLGNDRGQGELGRRDVDLWRAELLLAVDQFDAARLAATDGLTAAQARRQASAATAWQRFLGRYLLQTGRLSEAAETLDGLLAVGHGHDTTTADAAALVARGRLAIHTGDGRRAKSLRQSAQGGLEHGSPEVRRHCAWLLALLDMAAGDPGRARARLADLDGHSAVSPLPRLMVDVTDHAGLVRIARDVGDMNLALTAVEAVEELRHRNPDVESIAAAASHARGLLETDPMTLADAAQMYAMTPRLLARASALEDHGAELVCRGERDGGASSLSEALHIYSGAGANWDASRVRRRLRTLGIRRRLVKETRPASGWASLTQAEMAVAHLVADGLTNRAVATRLFISPHTVSMHLRHIYMKLEISSRVELTRLDFQHQQAA